MNWKVKVGGVILINAVIWGGLYYDAHSGRSPASLAPGADCQSAIDYYKTAGVNLVEDKGDKTGLTYSGDISVQGPGIISSKPINFVCSQTGAVTIFGINTTVDHNRTADAVKTLTPIFLLGAPMFQATAAQKTFFAEVASKLQPDNDWKTKIENGYVLRVMTTQADEQGNFFLTIQAGNAASYKE